MYGPQFRIIKDNPTQPSLIQVRALNTSKFSTRTRSGVRSTKSDNVQVKFALTAANFTVSGAAQFTIAVLMVSYEVQKGIGVRFLSGALFERSASLRLT